MHFEIGEVADYPLGKIEVTILSSARRMRIRYVHTGRRVVELAHLVEAGDGRLNPYGVNSWAVPVRHLRKRRPPTEPASWDDCVWKPKEVVC